jgi:hypothetical protein
MIKMPVIRTSAATKVKLFILSSPEAAEEKLQEWLQTQENIEIDHICQSQSERNGRFLFIVSIFYRTANDQNIN